MFQPQKQQNLQLRPRGSGFRVKDKRKADEARHVSGVSLNGGLERPLHEAMKLKPRLPWRTQDVGDARTWITCQGKLLTGSGTS